MGSSRMAIRSLSSALLSFSSTGSAAGGVKTVRACHDARSIIARSATHAWAPSQLRNADSSLPSRNGNSISFLRGFASLPLHIKLDMPSLSPTMNEGNLLEWKIKEGQELVAGDIIAEIETDKATMDWESQDDGYLAKILVADGTQGIKVGTTVAIMVEEKDDAAAFANYKDGDEAASEGSSDTAKESKSEPKPSSGGGGGDGGSGGGNKKFPAHTQLQMPALSPTMSAGTLAKWNVKVGDEVTAGDSFAEIETDKATMDWESQDDGFIAALLVEDGASDININTTVGVLVEDKESIAAFKGVTAGDLADGDDSLPSDEGKDASPAPGAEQEQQQQQQQQQQQPNTSSQSGESAGGAQKQEGGRIVASPYARKLAQEKGIDLRDVQPTGSHGRVVAADVEAPIASGGGKTKSSASTGSGVSTKSLQGGGAEVPSRKEGGYHDIPNTNIRRITAARLLESKQSIPHYYVTTSVRVDKMMALRRQINEAMVSDGIKLSVNDFIVKASALALRDVPEVNAAWMGEFIRQYHTVDVSVAVQTPNGLMVPVIRNTDTLGLADINAQVKALAAKAKENKLKPEQMTGGTFTISNLGMFGVDQFAAIINPPQVCILAVGAAVEKVVVAPGGGFEAAAYINATLSCDHRVVDGALGAQWLQAFKKRIESPLEMLI